MCHAGHTKKNDRTCVRSACLLSEFKSVQSYSANGAIAYAGTAVDACISVNLSLAFIVQCNCTNSFDLNSANTPALAKSSTN